MIEVTMTFGSNKTPPSSATIIVLGDRAATGPRPGAAGSYEPTNSIAEPNVPIGAKKPSGAPAHDGQDLGNATKISAAAARYSLIAASLEQLCLIFDEPADWELKEPIYHRALDHLGDLVPLAVDRYIASPGSKFFPKPGELIGQVADELADLERGRERRTRDRQFEDERRLALAKPSTGYDTLSPAEQAAFDAKMEEFWRSIGGRPRPRGPILPPHFDGAALTFRRIDEALAEAAE
jgi:hypothetical protein